MHNIAQRVGIALVLAAGMLLSPALALSAQAHTDPRIIVQIDTVHPALPAGVKIGIVGSETTELFLSNASASPVEVLDPTGRPFLQVSSRGVLGDASSPYLAITAGAMAGARPAPARCCPVGNWLQLSTRSGWAWADPRIDPAIYQLSPTGDRGLGALQSGQPLATFQLGLRLGSSTYTANGALVMRPLGTVHSYVDIQPKGVVASVVDGRDATLTVRAARGVSVVVLDDRQQPLIRLQNPGSGPWMRVNSDAYRTTETVLGLGSATRGAWAQIGTPAMTSAMWIDPRVDYFSRLPTTQLQYPETINRWTIDVIVNGRHSVIQGHSVWTPTSSAAEANAILAAQSPNRISHLVEVIAAAGLTALLVVALVAMRMLKRKNRS